MERRTSSRVRRAPSTLGVMVPSNIVINVTKRIAKENRERRRLQELGADKAEKLRKVRAQREKSKIRKEERARAGLVSGMSNGRKRNSDGPMIPWIPFVKTGNKIQLSPGLTTEGHGRATYTSSWIAPDKKVPGVIVSRTTANSDTSGVPHAVYTGGTYIVNSTQPANSDNANLYLTKRPLSLNGMRNSSKQKLIRDKLLGPSVDGLTALLYTIDAAGRVTPKGGVDIKTKRDLYSLKLLGDKFTAIEAQRLNKSGDNYIVRPYSESFVDYIEGFNWANDKAEQEKMTQKMINERDNFLPFYFEKGVVYTGDRPLFLFCVKNEIPCIIERGKNSFAFTGINVPDIKREFTAFLNSKSIRRGLKPNHQQIIEQCLSDASGVKMSIFDCFHDFGKNDKRSFIGAAQLGSDLKEIYDVTNKRTDPIHMFINLFNSSTTVKSAENLITEFLDTIDSDPRYSRFKYNDTTLTNLFKSGRLIDYCIMYDAGTAIPLSVYERIAATTQRVTNGFYGAPAIRRRANFKNIQQSLQRFNLPNLHFTNENLDLIYK